MKYLFRNALLILSLLSLVACTEEISDEVQNKQTTQSSDDISDYSSRSISLKHKMDETLSFLMHKSGNSQAACELSAPTAGFDADTYDYADSNYALDCVLDVQELDLYYNGVELELQVDDQLCEYVEYVPYAVMRFQPGATKNTVYKVSCDSVCAADPATENLCDKTYDDDITAKTFTNQILETDFLCRFDYGGINQGSEWGHYPNCDEGEILTRNYELQGVPDDPNTLADESSCDGGAFADMTIVFQDETETECGGDRNSCLDGAALEDFDVTKFSSEIYDNPELDSLTIGKTYSKMYGEDRYNTNMKLANYSRICADSTTQKTSNALYSTLTFSGADVEGIRTSQGVGDTFTYLDNTGVDEKIYLADNMFRGAANIKPYYAFYCLDKAFDVKAQIRLFIRDWDKDFLSTNAYLNYVSDAFLVTPAMDAGFTMQSPDIYWNNKKDIDNHFEQDTDDDDVIDFWVWNQNECTTSSSPFDPDNFPGTSF